ncbi:uncharacterized protein IWZ02DRAFT_506598 [Phyllosticta citriasiana]|uniref:uncharacterized protein n=1 Tax=Phyllosticta citriasiana TaxID=595635 RepID=UPI0030FD21AA
MHEEELKGNLDANPRGTTDQVMESTLNLLFLLENSRQLQKIHGKRSEQDSLHPANPAEHNNATAAHLLPHKSPRRASTAAKTTTRNLLLLIHLSSFHFPQSSRPRSITNASYVHRAHQADITSTARTHARTPFIQRSNERDQQKLLHYSSTSPRLPAHPRGERGGVFFAGRRRGVVGCCGAGHGPVAGRLRAMHARAYVRTPASPAPDDGRARGAGPDAAGGLRKTTRVPTLLWMVMSNGCEAHFLRLFFPSLWDKSGMDGWMDRERLCASCGDDDEENISSQSGSISGSRLSPSPRPPSPSPTTDSPSTTLGNVCSDRLAWHRMAGFFNGDGRGRWVGGDVDHVAHSLAVVMMK